MYSGGGTVEKDRGFTTKIGGHATVGVRGGGDSNEPAGEQRQTGRGNGREPAVGEGVTPLYR